MAPHLGTVQAAGVHPSVMGMPPFVPFNWEGANLRHHSSWLGSIQPSTCSHPSADMHVRSDDHYCAHALVYQPSNEQTDIYCGDSYLEKTKWHQIKLH